MSSLVADIGALDLTRRRRGRPDDAFGALVRSVVGQQLSTKAARTIYERLAALFGGRVPPPAELLAADEEELRAAGLSGRKTEYLRDLAGKVESGDLDLYSLHSLTDEEVANRLVSVRGLGQWTADMFLMFHLDRPDVLPVGDLGIRRAAEKAYGLPEAPPPGELLSLAAPWKPHRTLACIYLWESLDTVSIAATSS
ncbi:DNA-3-methyladenine glycosylase [soil metagenome]|jgi:DNA-3-methyladenine glycosylase II